MTTPYVDKRVLDANNRPIYTPVTAVSPYGDDVKVQTPDFDSRQLATPYLTPGGGKLFRGMLYQDKRDPSVVGKPLGFRFLYNPTSVNVSYSMDTSRYPGDDQPSGGGAVPLIGVPGAASVSWDLLLDRTYSTWNFHNHSAGIRTDVEQFERIVGYTPDTPFVQARAVWVVFGVNSGLTFYGFIQGFQVVYTHWTQSMIPYRGGISGITLQVLPTSVDPGAKTDSGQTSVQQASGGGASSTGTDPNLPVPPATDNPNDPTTTSQDPTGRNPGRPAT